MPLAPLNQADRSVDLIALAAMCTVWEDGEALVVLRFLRMQWTYLMVHESAAGGEER